MNCRKLWSGSKTALPAPFVAARSTSRRRLWNSDVPSLLAILGTDGRSCMRTAASVTFSPNTVVRSAALSSSSAMARRSLTAVRPYPFRWRTRPTRSSVGAASRTGRCGDTPPRSCPGACAPARPRTPHAGRWSAPLTSHENCCETVRGHVAAPHPPQRHQERHTAERLGPRPSRKDVL